MPQPPGSQVHLSVPLSNMALRYANDMDAYIAGRVFPIVPADKQFNKYYTFPKSYWFRNDVKKRADAAEENLNTGRLAVGVGLVPTGAIWQFDVAYEVNVQSDINTDRSRFSAYLRYLF